MHVSELIAFSITLAACVTGSVRLIVETVQLLVQFVGL
jgi:hypothetical protein